MVGIGIAASGHWPYAIRYNGAMALANLNFAILMRNELFGRVLYAIVNFCFAKVRLAKSRSYLFSRHKLPTRVVVSIVVATRLHVSSTAPWRHSQWLCPFRRLLAHSKSRQQLSQSSNQPRCHLGSWYGHKPHCYHQCLERIPVGS